MLPPIGIAGTAMVEDLHVRRMLAFCKRLYTLMTTNDICMAVFHRLADRLDQEMYNKLLCVFDVFGMEELTDFIRISKPRATDKLALDYTLSMRPPASQAPTNLLTTAASLGALKQDSRAHSLQKKLKPFKPMPATRVQQLLASGCPILRIANQIAEVRHTPDLMTVDTAVYICQARCPMACIC